MELNQPEPTFISEGQYLISFTGKFCIVGKFVSICKKKVVIFILVMKMEENIPVEIYKNEFPRHFQED